MFLWKVVVSLWSDIFINNKNVLQMTETKSKRPTAGAKSLTEKRKDTAKAGTKKTAATKTPAKDKAANKPKPKASTPASTKKAVAKKAAPAHKKGAGKVKAQPKAKKAATAPAEATTPKKTGRPVAIPDKSRETVDLTKPIMKCIAKLHIGKEKFNSPYIRKAVIAQIKKDGFKAGIDFVEC